MTAQHGKNHLGDRNEYLPTVHGFDEFYGNLYEAPAEVWHACCSLESPQASIPPQGDQGRLAPLRANYCRRYRPAARMPQPIDTSTSHLGFRCVIPG